ncbi:MAG: S9 family peptidase [Planctomycetota bacterium]|jgi:dipeptidyl-peptidase-4
MFRSFRVSLAVIALLSGAFSSEGLRAADNADQKQSKKSRKKPDPAVLTLDRIYGGSEFASRSVSVQWLPDGRAWLTLKPVGNSGAKQIIRVDAETGDETVFVEPARLTPGLEAAPLGIDGFQLSGDGSRVLIYTNSRRVWRRKSRGDYWVLDLSSNDLRKLGGDAPASTLMFAKFAPNSDRVAYVRERNIYLEDLLSGQITRLTETPNDDVINGTFDWVYEEELGLRDGFRWSPDGQAIAYWQIKTEGVSRIPLVNNTVGLYPSLLMLPYPKTGQTNSICRVGVVSIESRTTKWLSIPGDPRNHYIARMAWAGNSDELVLQQLNRLQNTNRVMLANVSESTVETFLTERDDAWVRVHDEMFWLKDGKEFTWLSERDGWRHLYIASRDGNQTRLVTRGDYDVIQLLHVDEQREVAWFIASPENPTERYLYSIRLDGSGFRRVTPEEFSGTHGYSISPTGDFAVHTRSTIDMPPVSTLIGLPEHEVVRVLESNARLHKVVAKLDCGTTEFFRVEIEDGVELDGWRIKPPGFGAKENRGKKWPLLIYVYGEPAGQTVLNRWRGSSHLWHQMLSQQGCVVMSIDNRGTPAPRGREWRKMVYRQVGTLGPDDQAAALKVLLKKHKWIDRERVGIWGWSGGGSSSLHAIFRYPDLYRTAISIAPVPNQRYYDTIYQERYMGLPSDNVEGYRNGSAMNFASQLKGNLLLIHGTGDDNCHYQTTELLINELVRHNKPFQMMAYPYRTHSIREGTNTTRHLRDLMTRYLYQHLLRTAP